MFVHETKMSQVFSLLITKRLCCKKDNKQKFKHLLKMWSFLVDEINLIFKMNIYCY